MNRSMPGLPVHHQLLEATQTHVHWVSDAIQPSHPLSVVPFSSCPQSFPASGSFQMSQLFTWGSQSIGVSSSTSVLQVNTQDWSPLGWAGWISLQSKGLSGVFSNTTVQKHQFFFFFFFLLYNIVLVLPYINVNPPWVYTCSPSWTPFPPPSPYHPSGSSQRTSRKHPVSCIEPGLAIHFIYDIIHVSMPFSQIIPPSPSLTESKRLFYTCVSFAVSHTGLLLPSF